MTMKTTLCTTLVAASFSLILPQASFAETPARKSLGTVIHLADNLNEEAKLGWCIDTDGRELTNLLHAHSCKPSGDYVLFTFAPDTGMVGSAIYEGLCMADNDPENAVNPFGLISCDDADPALSLIHI